MSTTLKAVFPSVANGFSFCSFRTLRQERLLHCQNFAQKTNPTDTLARRGWEPKLQVRTRGTFSETFTRVKSQDSTQHLRFPQLLFLCIHTCSASLRSLPTRLCHARESMIRFLPQAQQGCIAVAQVYALPRLLVNALEQVFVCLLRFLC